MSLEPVDELVGRRVVLEFSVGLQFRKDLHGQLLTQFNTPLVVAVDVPDHALGEDLVFVHGDEGAQTFRRNVVHHDGVDGLVVLRRPFSLASRVRLAPPPPSLTQISK